MKGRLAKIDLNNYKPLREIVFETLREAIVTGGLKPGERLMEVHLAAKMGVSRTPVREAIRKLELEGLITMTPRKGVHVSGLSEKEIIDALEVRTAVEGLAASLAASRISPEELRELKKTGTQFKSYMDKGNLQGLVKKDIEFHDIIYQATKNDKLIQISSSLREQVQRFRIIYIKDFSSQNDLSSEHAEILKAISSHDSALAKKVAESHIINQQNALIKALETDSSL
ncbi:MAG: GntR family transcriptional regulator [Eubacteriales bacterium]|nr:GntR family transcriptional regulator [Eubacteriales bacterium]